MPATDAGSYTAAGLRWWRASRCARAGSIPGSSSGGPLEPGCGRQFRRGRQTRAPGPRAAIDHKPAGRCSAIRHLPSPERRIGLSPYVTSSGRWAPPDRYGDPLRVLAFPPCRRAGCCGSMRSCSALDLVLRRRRGEFLSRSGAAVDQRRSRPASDRAARPLR